MSEKSEKELRIENETLKLENKRLHALVAEFERYFKIGDNKKELLAKLRTERTIAGAWKSGSF